MSEEDINWALDHNYFTGWGEIGDVMSDNENE